MIKIDSNAERMLRYRKSCKIFNISGSIVFLLCFLVVAINPDAKIFIPVQNNIASIKYICILISAAIWAFKFTFFSETSNIGKNFRTRFYGHDPFSPTAGDIDETSEILERTPTEEDELLETLIPALIDGFKNGLRPIILPQSDGSYNISCVNKKHDMLSIGKILGIVDLDDSKVVSCVSVEEVQDVFEGISKYKTKQS